MPLFLAQMVKNPPAKQETQVRSLDQEDPLEMGMATHSSILAWRIPWTSDHYMASLPCQRNLSGYSPWGRRVRHDWATKQACTCPCSYVPRTDRESGQHCVVWAERRISPDELHPAARPPTFGVWHGIRADIWSRLEEPTSKTQCSSPTRICVRVLLRLMP